jgi:aubergine
MRQETIYDIMRSLRREDEANWKDNFKREMLSATVLTSYSNATYRIDDVVFNMSPNSTFMKKDGSQMSIKEYYKEKYKIDIRDPDQPLLVSNPKPRDLRRQEKTGQENKPDQALQEKLILLVPELCRATGITDKMRSNFQLMKMMVSLV